MQSHPFLLVMIAVKDRKSVSFLKLEPFILTSSTKDLLLFDPFIVSVFVQHVQTKAVTSHLFTRFFVLIQLHLFSSRLRLLCWSTLTMPNDLPIFASYYVDWLILSHMIISLIYNSLGFLLMFCFSLTKGQHSKR